MFSAKQAFVGREERSSHIGCMGSLILRSSRSFVAPCIGRPFFVTPYSCHFAYKKNRHCQCLPPQCSRHHFQKEILFKMLPVSKLSGAPWRWGVKRKENLLLRLWNLNVEKVNVECCWLVEMTLVMVSLPVSNYVFFDICTHFHFTLIGGNLTAQSTGSHWGIQISET